MRHSFNLESYLDVAARYNPVGLYRFAKWLGMDVAWMDPPDLAQVVKWHLKQQDFLLASDHDLQG